MSCGAAGHAVPRQADAADRACPATSTTTRPTQPVLVFADGDRIMGLMVDEIVDVVEDRLDIELSGAPARPAGHGGDRRPGHRCAGYRLLADAGLAGLVPRRHRKGAGGQAQRMLVVEDSDFFRQLLVPALGAAGFQVTAVASAAEALRLRDAGAMFDAIVSDIEMPDMDGLAFARAHPRRRRLGGPADDRADRPCRPGSRRRRPGRRLHRLRGEIRARQPAGQPAPVPVGAMHSVTHFARPIAGLT